VSDHAAHDHAVARDTDRRLLGAALGVLGAFFVAEFTAGIVSGSLVLVADAGHLLTDVIALAASAWALHLAQQPAYGRWTYGLKRAEILAAAVNGVTLVVAGALVAFEAVRRLVDPSSVPATVLLVTAVVGLVVNVVVVNLLRRANRSRLNIRAAYAHATTDLAAFVATAIAGVVIAATHWYRADAVASLLVVVLMAWAAWGLLRDSGKILLQATPDHLDLEAVRAHLVALEYVTDVHDLHAWTVTSGDVTLAAHVVTSADCFTAGDAPRLLDELQHCLSEHFAIEHATFQLEPPSHEEHEPGLHR
jgi:cobalt-zinc-cadmium efflux system protein